MKKIPTRFTAVLQEMRREGLEVSLGRVERSPQQTQTQTQKGGRIKELENRVAELEAQLAVKESA